MYLRYPWLQSFWRIRSRYDGKKKWIKKQGETILQDLRIKKSNGAYGGCIRCDVHDVLKCVSETRMKTKYDDRIEECTPSKTVNLW